MNRVSLEGLVCFVPFFRKKKTISSDKIKEREIPREGEGKTPIQN